MNDKCILCDKETEFPKDTLIEKRSWYVEGSGQLCEDCYNKIYHVKKITNVNE
jgi:uncharacterized protein YlaI